MELKLFGNCTVLIETKETKIILDPYFSNNGNPMYRRGIPVSEDYKDIEELDGILLSHEHFDHMNSKFLEKFKDKSQIYAPKLSVKTRAFNRKGIKKGDKFSIKDIKVTVVQANHICPTVGYIIEAENNKIYFSGDTYYGSFIEDIASNSQIDIAILPVTNYFPPMTMGKSGVSKALSVLKPKCFIPMHKDLMQRIRKGNYTISKESCEELVKNLNLNIELRYLENGEKYSF